MSLWGLKLDLGMFPMEQSSYPVETFLVSKERCLVYLWTHQSWNPWCRGSWMIFRLLCWKKPLNFETGIFSFKPDSSSYFTVSFETAAFCTRGKVYFLWGTFRNIVDVNSYNELKAAISEGKWARGPWSARYVVLYPLFPCIIISELSMPYTGYQWP